MPEIKTLISDELKQRIEDLLSLSSGLNTAGRKLFGIRREVLSGLPYPKSNNH
jgi:hypothetical protein